MATSPSPSMAGGTAGATGEGAWSGGSGSGASGCTKLLLLGSGAGAEGSVSGSAAGAGCCRGLLEAASPPASWVGVGEGASAWPRNAAHCRKNATDEDLCTAIIFRARSRRNMPHTRN